MFGIRFQEENIQPSTAVSEDLGGKMRKRKDKQRMRKIEDWERHLVSCMLPAPPVIRLQSDRLERGQRVGGLRKVCLNFMLVALFAIIGCCSSRPSKLEFGGAEDKAASVGQWRHSNRNLNIPGLYEQSNLLTPIQGQAQFEQLVVYANNSNGANQTISLVQFYMATCPDCQGFSPYFKRFVNDIGPHWRHLVRIFVVNCNDDLNIPLCWQQNPTLTVPLLRWYTFPVLLQDSLERRRHFSYPIDLLNVAHRQYIEKQRRDLISLRHATLRFLSSILEQLVSPTPSSNETARSMETLKMETNATSNVTTRYENNNRLFETLPMRIKLLRQLGRPIDRREPDRFVEQLNRRASECLSANLTPPADLGRLENFIVFERRGSFAGKTLVADWSNFTCSSIFESIDGSKALLMIHYSNNLDLLNQLSPPIEGAKSESGAPKLFRFSLKVGQKIVNMSDLDLVLVETNSTKTKRNPSKRSHSHENSMAEQRANGVHFNSRMDRLMQRKSLEQFYSRHRFPYKYVTSMAAKSIRVRNKREVQTSNHLEAENINWAPNELYPDEEVLRYQYNRQVCTLLQRNNCDISVAGFRDGNQAEIKKNKTVGANEVANARDEDLKNPLLTDYYKVLYEIVQKNILSRAEVDGYQLAATTCLLHQLSRHFPFQGNQARSHKSIARHYLELLSQRYSDKLSEQMKAPFGGCSGPLASDKLKMVRVASNELESMQTEISKHYGVGLPSESLFKWTYCKGSSAYLRGHTCSLWVLFHTLTVHEFLHSNKQVASRPTRAQANEEQEYKFAVNYTKRANCDPQNPEPAFMNLTSGQLYLDAPQFMLANIINFVRYYLACTNCASHFNCMIQHSNLDFQNPAPEDHLLWLWEAHNRVNVRTSKTHSEDPAHPKHVFPVYEACPSCYLERPLDPFDFERMRFNKRELIDFLVAKYRKSSILNNKVRIEDLFKRQT